MSAGLALLRNIDRVDGVTPGEWTGISVVGSAADGEEAIRVCGEQRPDVVLMDVRMPGLDGIAPTRRLAGGPKVIILTTFDLDDYVYDALSAGASGFLLKDAGAERLFEAVRVVAAGDALLAPQVTPACSPRAARTPRSPAGSCSATRRSRPM